MSEWNLQKKQAWTFCRLEILSRDKTITPHPSAHNIKNKTKQTRLYANKQRQTNEKKKLPKKKKKKRKNSMLWWLGSYLATMYNDIVDVVCRCSGEEDAGIQEGSRTAAATNKENRNCKWLGPDYVFKMGRTVHWMGCLFVVVIFFWWGGWGGSKGMIQIRSSFSLFCQRPSWAVLALIGTSTFWHWPSAFPLLAMLSSALKVSWRMVLERLAFRMVLEKLFWHLTCLNHTHFLHLTAARRGSCGLTRSWYTSCISL